MHILSKGILPKLIISMSIILLCVFSCAVLIGSVSRYFFATGSVKLEDFIGHMFAALMLLSVLIAFYRNKHVRVDMISKWRPTLEKPVALIFYAIPFVFIAVLSLPAVQFSWSIFEGSSEAGGLGGIFIVKTLLPVTFVLIALTLFSRKRDMK